MARLAGLVLLALAAAAQEEPQPLIVTPARDDRPPSDAVLLFDGRDMEGWVTAEGNPALCHVEDSTMVCTSGVGNIFSKARFQSAQLHLEFSVPPMPDQKGQLRGNSGVYIQGRYEIQILDSYENETYPKGALGALYGQSAPLVNAARPPGEWQTYDITFRAPQCDSEGKIVEKGVVTVLLNGILIQDHVAIDNMEGNCDPGPLMLQDHSGFPGAPVTTMRFRNLWFRPLDATPPVATRERR
jgi:hypothetical protein